MWWLRSVCNRNHFRDKDCTDEAHLRRALESFGAPDETMRMSVYSVDDTKEGQDIAAAHSMLIKPQPEPFSYLLIEPIVLENLGLRVVAAHGGTTHGFLNERHYNIEGVTESSSRQLVKELLGHPDLLAERLSKSELIAIAKAHVAQYPSALSLVEGADRAKWLTAIRLNG